MGKVRQTRYQIPSIDCLIESSKRLMRVLRLLLVVVRRRVCVCVRERKVVA